MRIFSKFNDYYDTALGYGIDPFITYKRESKSFPWSSEIGKDISAAIDIVNLDHTRDYSRIFNRPFPSNVFKSDKITVEDAICVIFCGYMRVGVKLLKTGYFKEEQPEFCFDMESVKRFFKKHKEKLIKRSPKSRWFYNPGVDEEQLEDFFKTYTTFRQKKFTDLHFKADSPVILFTRSANNDQTIILNPCLKDIQFFKAFDAFTAFQELAMFIGGVMGGTIPSIVEISDRDKIAKHGFNEWSFRKEKAI